MRNRPSAPNSSVFNNKEPSSSALRLSVHNKSARERNEAQIEDQASESIEGPLAARLCAASHVRETDAEWNSPEPGLNRTG